MKSIFFKISSAPSTDTGFVDPDDQVIFLQEQITEFFQNSTYRSETASTLYAESYDALQVTGLLQELSASHRFRDTIYSHPKFKSQILDLSKPHQEIISSCVNVLSRHHYYSSVVRDWLHKEDSNPLLSALELAVLIRESCEKDKKTKTIHSEALKEIMQCLLDDVTAYAERLNPAQLLECKTQLWAFKNQIEEFRSHVFFSNPPDMDHFKKVLAACPKFAGNDATKIHFVEESPDAPLPESDDKEVFPLWSKSTYPLRDHINTQLQRLNLVDPREHQQNIEKIMGWISSRYTDIAVFRGSHGKITVPRVFSRDTAPASVQACRARLVQLMGCTLPEQRAQAAPVSQAVANTAAASRKRVAGPQEKAEPSSQNAKNLILTYRVFPIVFEQLLMDFLDQFDPSRAQKATKLLKSEFDAFEQNCKAWVTYCSTLDLSPTSTLGPLQCHFDSLEEVDEALFTLKKTDFLPTAYLDQHSKLKTHLLERKDTIIANKTKSALDELTTEFNDARTLFKHPLSQQILRINNLCSNSFARSALCSEASGLDAVLDVGQMVIGDASKYEAKLTELKEKASSHPSLRDEIQEELIHIRDQKKQVKTVLSIFIEDWLRYITHPNQIKALGRTEIMRRFQDAKPVMTSLFSSKKSKTFSNAETIETRLQTTVTQAQEKIQSENRWWWGKALGMGAAALLTGAYFTRGASNADPLKDSSNPCGTAPNWGEANSLLTNFSYEYKVGTGQNKKFVQLFPKQLDCDPESAQFRRAVYQVGNHDSPFKTLYGDGNRVYAFELLGSDTGSVRDVVSRTYHVPTMHMDTIFDLPAPMHELEGPALIAESSQFFLVGNHPNQATRITQVFSRDYTYENPQTKQHIQLPEELRFRVGTRTPKIRLPEQFRRIDLWNGTAISEFQDYLHSHI